ncbi:hypothetical protein BJ322DRAFT_1112540 [Thelephora terrestris]|uniref:DUF6533 domain-containing protein n=1 Tax=Thelephora terrestris TaxID=56493 RepID=A0A9P6H757_9AGAM|nr:hypothetical protein BJ322DRAFT_1112540 [Thelephora terrestris]
MSSALDELVQGGQDITSIKSTQYYWVALATLLFYDYFLTLRDEVRYAWKGEKSWASAIFFLVRIVDPPRASSISELIPHIEQVYTDCLRNMGYCVCNKSAFIEILFFVWCTLIAQIVLNLRLYAITMKSVIVTGFFACITASQLALGIYWTNLAANAPAQQLPPIHLMAYQLCIFTRHRKVEMAYTAMSLAYDFLAFLVIVALAVGSTNGGFKMPHILRTIVRDSTVYFLIIFTSHLVLEMTLLLARLNLQLLPAIGNIVYLPIMIGRLMLSLKKAVDNSQASEWSLTSVTHTSHPGVHTVKRPYNMRFVSRSDEDTVLPAEGDTPLATA